MNKLHKKDYPETLKNVGRIPDFLYMRGNMPPSDYKYLCVIGSRSYSSYGKEACINIISGLRGYPIVIVSGLALGIDSIAHEAALDAGLPTISFPGSGLDESVIYPVSHKNLADRIVKSGGALLSKFEPQEEPTKWTFVVRNELMAGISHATLVIEARKKSGTLTTVKSALRFGRDVMVVPGSIFSELSETPVRLMKEGAQPVFNSRDVLSILGLIPDEEYDLFGDESPQAISQPQLGLYSNISPDEQKILSELIAPISRDDLIRKLNMPPGYVNSVLVEMEIRGQIRENSGFLFIKK